MSTFTPARRTGKRDTFVPAKRGKRDVFIPAIRSARQCEPGFTPAKRSSSKGQVFVPAKRPASSDKFYPAKGKGKLEGIGLLSMRGIDYPEWYHGLIDHTYIEVTKIRDRADVRCRFLFGKDKRRPATTTKDIKFKEIDNRLERARISFFQHGEINLDVLRTPIGRDYGWPVNVDTDLFDHITLEVRDDGSNELFLLTHIRVVLNGIVILDRSFEQRRVEKYFQMDRYIGEYRLSRVPHSDDSPVLHTAALELGKSWSPKYYAKWHMWNSEIGVFYLASEPAEWCSEFAAWAIRKATNMDPVTPYLDSGGTGKISIGNWRLGKYFMGLNENSDHFNNNEFISPNHRIVLWEDYEILWLSENVPAEIKSDVTKKKYDYDGNELLINGNTIYYKGYNAQYCSWLDLENRIEPGFYALLTNPGHSTFFVNWTESNFQQKDRVEFLAIGGNQGNRVTLTRFPVYKKGNREFGIFWNDADLADEYCKGISPKKGYQGGFGKI